MERKVTKVSDVFGEIGPAAPLETEAEGGGGHMGTRVHARARLPVTVGDDNPDLDEVWAAAVCAWDQIRAKVRRMPAGRQAQAWQVAVEALARLAAEIDGRFGGSR